MLPLLYITALTVERTYIEISVSVCLSKSILPEALMSYITSISRVFLCVGTGHLSVASFDWRHDGRWTINRRRLSSDERTPAADNSGYSHRRCRSIVAKCGNACCAACSYLSVCLHIRARSVVMYRGRLGDKSVSLDWNDQCDAMTRLLLNT